MLTHWILTLARAWTVGLVACAAIATGAERVALTSLELGHLYVAGWQALRPDQTFSGRPISIGGRTFEHGIGTRATTTLWVELDGKVDGFSAWLGVDDSAAP